MIVRRSSPIGTRRSYYRRGVGDTGPTDPFGLSQPWTTPASTSAPFHSADGRLWSGQGTTDPSIPFCWRGIPLPDESDIAASPGAPNATAAYQARLAAYYAQCGAPRNYFDAVTGLQVTDPNHAIDRSRPGVAFPNIYAPATQPASLVKAAVVKASASAGSASASAGSAVAGASAGSVVIDPPASGFDFSFLTKPASILGIMFGGGLLLMRGRR